MLADRLRMPVGAMLDSMTDEEFVMWKAYYERLDIETKQERAKAEMAARARRR
jgi:hypothetical protein